MEYEAAVNKMMQHVNIPVLTELSLLYVHVMTA